jgi:hypothetical protein
MAEDFGCNQHDEMIAACSMLAFAAALVPAPISGDGSGDDELDEFDRNVAALAAQIARLALSLPALARVASGLEQPAGAAWGTLAEEFRQDYPRICNLHFAGMVLTTVEAIRHLALTMPPGTQVDLSARLKIFAMGLDVVPERREGIRALLMRDIDVLLGKPHAARPSLAEPVAPPTGRSDKSGQASVG